MRARIAPDLDRAATSAWTGAEDRAPDWVAGGTPEPLRAQLIRALGHDRVLTTALDLIKYASDASPYRSIPRAVAMPRDLDDIVRLLGFAREHRMPLVFRAGGTSLSGQAQTDSILVDVRRHWQRARVLDGGARVRAQPGTVLGHVNRLLARHGRRLGPDPASSEIACLGGVIANNSGGMRCGVVADAYRTVASMTFALANGAVIDSAAMQAEERFRTAAPELAAGLLEIRDQIRADTALAARIRRKFEIKNTTGYRLCAFLDADSPAEIFRRLVIGSEGTLAFVAEAVLDTVPLHPHATVGLVLFEDVDAAAAVVPALVGAGATATELMVAPTLIAAAYNMPGTPERWKTLPPSSATLLIEFRSADPDDLTTAEATAREALSASALLDEPAFTRDAGEIAMLWHVREGMQGLLAAMRPPGVSLIIEDICVPPARIAESARDLQALLSNHGFLPGVAGHASAGNLHFLLTPNFAKPADVGRYEAFMEELVELVVGKYDGSLKAEHGTGVNMAPFVEREWGPAATELMWRIKRLADPDGILGPGIVLSRDPTVHLRHLKSAPEIEPVATKCIECGFCEPVCPSRHLTTTPRQRIALRREMARQAPGSPVLHALREQYEYEGLQTCAVDGSCLEACPVGIDTGRLVKDLRSAQHGPRAQRAALEVARRSIAAERITRAGLRAGGGAVGRASGRAFPHAAPGALPFTVRDGAAAVYMPACLNRIIGNDRGSPAHPTVPEALVALSQRARCPLWIPDDVGGQCCGTPWTSKGYRGGHEHVAARMRARLERWSDRGRLPVVIDASSCAHGLITEIAAEGVEVVDAITWVHDHVLPELNVSHKLSRVAVHPTCATRHLGLSGELTAIAAAVAEEVIVPAASGCCGMAGDRGWRYPELPAAALRDVAAELAADGFDAYLSSNRTCEAALREVTGRPYASFVLALEELTRSAAGGVVA